MYAIVDIETTGGNASLDKITEIAVILHDGQKIVREFSTLINPECSIPYSITALTGITNDMVADAPRFYEVARELVEMTENKIFVAHNVAFDYGFVRNEFQRLGFEYKRERLCTVRLSRRLVPGHPSYSLGNICRALNIEISDRHRALGDARATAQLLNYLLSRETPASGPLSDTAPRITEHHPLLDVRKINDLPEEPGVYYFYNQHKELIYIGKSKNIRQRVISHFMRTPTVKSIRMRSQVADIGFELTGSDLLAQIRESYEIKEFKPLFNRRQRRSLFRYALASHYNDQGYFCLSLRKSAPNEDALASFTTKAEALAFLNRLIDKYGLCQKMCGIYPSAGPCFHFEIQLCRGACVGKELPEMYNRRAQSVVQQIASGFQNILILEAGRSKEERSVVKLEQGRFIGYGYCDISYAAVDASVWHECIQPFPDNRDVHYIVTHYLQNNKSAKVVPY
jgi:DNA polymerase-3 subunit epsilon